MKTEIFKSGAVVLWLRDDGIFHVQPSGTPGGATEQEVTAMFDAAERLLGGAKAPLLIDRSRSYSPSFGVLQILASRGADLCSAIAYYAPTAPAQTASRVVVTAMLPESIKNVAIFDEEAAALQWLAGFVARA